VAWKGRGGLGGILERRSCSVVLVGRQANGKVGFTFVDIVCFACMFAPLPVKWERYIERARFTLGRNYVLALVRRKSLRTGDSASCSVLHRALYSSVGLTASHTSKFMSFPSLGLLTMSSLFGFLGTGFWSVSTTSKKSVCRQKSVSSVVGGNRSD
jgi:hypothetical protein